jgi:hypothetical protein
MDYNKGFQGFFFFVIIFQSIVSISLLSRFTEYTALSELSTYGLGNMRNDYPRYFSTLDGLLGMDALSILAALFGVMVLAKP